MQGVSSMCVKGPSWYCATIATVWFQNIFIIPSRKAFSLLPLYRGFCALALALGNWKSQPFKTVAYPPAWKLFLQSAFFPVDKEQRPTQSPIQSSAASSLLCGTQTLPHGACSPAYSVDEAKYSVITHFVSETNQVL